MPSNQKQFSRVQTSKTKALLQSLQFMEEIHHYLTYPRIFDIRVVEGLLVVQDFLSEQYISRKPGTPYLGNVPYMILG